MKTIRFYNGIEMPILGFGSARIKGEECITAVTNAIRSGYRLIDTANMYQNEKEIGIAISKSGVKREELFITTKLCSEVSDKTQAILHIEKSLKELNTNYLDLVLVHEPYLKDLELYQVLEEYYDKGIIKAIGISNFSLLYLEVFLTRVRIQPMLHQIECHPYNQQCEMKAFLDSKGIVMQSYAPFISGDKEILEDKVLLKIAIKYNKTIHQVILAYLMQRGIGVIPKTVVPKRMRENLDSIDFILTEEDMILISSLDKRHSYYGWDED